MTDNKDWKQIDWPELDAWNKAQEHGPRFGRMIINYDPAPQRATIEQPATLETLILQNDMLYGKMDRMHNTISELEKRVLELTEILKLKVT